MSVYTGLGNPPQVLAATPPASSGSPSSPCCTTGRPILADPISGHTVCSCQLDPARMLAYPRLGAAGYPFSEQGYVGLPDPAAATAALYANLGGAYDMKDAPGALPGLGTPAPYYNPYDPAAAAMYPYTNGYCGFDFNSAAHRKNATREATNTLKAWLKEHKKNPYPTKGEKIMLAIITKMTLTQVSTWFANARRRLKKENKMTWEPRNRTDDDDDNDENGNDKKEDCDESKNEDAAEDAARVSDRESSNGSISPGASEVGEASSAPAARPPSPPKPADDTPKPRIWSLAHTAMSGSGERPSLGVLPAGLPALPKISSHASPLYPYSSAFSPLKPWLGRPYPAASLAALSAPLALTGAPAHHVLSRAGLAQVSTVSSSALGRVSPPPPPVVPLPASMTTMMRDNLTSGPSTLTSESPPHEQPSPPVRSPPATPRAALSPRERFSVSELCRKDDESTATRSRIRF